MWFFDSILEEAPKTGVVSTPVTKKDEQDGSFLIIDDSVSANQLPDTAVQLFDAAPETVSNEVETVSVSGVSFFSEPSVTVTEGSETVAEASESVPSEIAFFSESTNESVGDAEIIPAMPEAEDSTEDAAPMIAEPTMEISAESAVLSEVDEITESAQKDASISEIVPMEEMTTKTDTVSVSEKNDIYAPLRKAIAEYDEILTSRDQLSQAKDAEISAHNTRIAQKKAEYNAFIAEAKEAAKKSLEERKFLEMGTEQIKQMKETLLLQIK